MLPEIRNMLKRSRLALLTTYIALWLGVALAAQAGEPEAYAVEFQVTLEPARLGASVTITVDRGELLKHVNFQNRNASISEIKATGSLREKDGRVFWDLPSGRSTLSYFVRIPHERSPANTTRSSTRTGRFSAATTSCPRCRSIRRGDGRVLPVHAGVRAARGLESCADRLAPVAGQYVPHRQSRSAGSTGPPGG
jgi:hypothetical protein